MRGHRLKTYDCVYGSTNYYDYYDNSHSNTHEWDIATNPSSAIDERVFLTNPQMKHSHFWNSCFVKPVWARVEWVLPWHTLRYSEKQLFSIHSQITPLALVKCKLQYVSLLWPCNTSQVIPLQTHNDPSCGKQKQHEHCSPMSFVRPPGAISNCMLTVSITGCQVPTVAVFDCAIARILTH